MSSETRKPGGKPLYIPIRKRGYYRALKRKEEWALSIAKFPKDSLCWYIAFGMRHVDWKQAMADHQMLELEKGDPWRGGYFPIPVVVDPDFDK